MSDLDSERDESAYRERAARTVATATGHGKCKRCRGTVLVYSDGTSEHTTSRAAETCRRYYNRRPHHA